MNETSRGKAIDGRPERTGERRMVRETRRTRYFQEISRAFLELRGAPYVLSARDIAAIAAWEKGRVPLAVVLEGIRRAYEKTRKRRDGRALPFSLFYCQAEVQRALNGYRDRLVGRHQKVFSRTEKAARARAEVEAFLKRIPPEIGVLREPFDQARALLSRRVPPEREIDELEEKINALIIGGATAEERDAVRRQLESDFPGRPEEEMAKILPVKLVKLAREKYRIPHLSLFYY